MPKKQSSSIFSDLITEKFDHKLRKVTSLKNLPEPLRSHLEEFYSDEALHINLLACLINGLYTEGIETFLLSFRELSSLMANDHKAKNIKRKTMTDKEFATFKAFLIKRKIISVEQDSTNFEEGKKGGLAAFCRLIEPRFLALIQSEKVGDELPQIYPIDENDEDYISPEQQEFEDKSPAVELDPALMKIIREKAKARHLANKQKNASDDQIPESNPKRKKDGNQNE